MLPAERTRQSLWRNRDFILLWIGQAISLLGSQLSLFVLPLLILAITGSPVHAGLIVAVERGTYLVVGLPAGVLIDHWNRKWVMIISDIVRCIVYGSLPMAYFLGHLTITHLYIIALVAGVALTFFDMANDAAFPRIVNSQQLHSATALMEGTGAAVELLGPGIAGLLVGWLASLPTGAAVVYLVDSISYLTSVLTLLSIKRPLQLPRTLAAPLSVKQQMTVGIRFLWVQRCLRLLALFTVGVNVFVSPVALSVIVLAKNELRVSATTIGLIFGIGGLGGIVGALLIPLLKAHLRVGQLLLGIVVFWTGGICLQAIATSTLMQILGWATFTFSVAVYYTMVYAYRISLVPDELQGRVNSVYRLLVFGGSVVGPALGGVLLGLISARAVLWIISIGLLLLVLIFSLTELRKA